MSLNFTDQTGTGVFNAIKRLVPLLLSFPDSSKKEERKNTHLRAIFETPPPFAKERLGSPPGGVVRGWYKIGENGRYIYRKKHLRVCFPRVKSILKVVNLFLFFTKLFLPFNQWGSIFWWVEEKNVGNIFGSKKKCKNNVMRHYHKRTFGQAHSNGRNKYSIERGHYTLP